LQENGRAFGLSLKSSEISTVSECLKNTGRTSTDAEKSETSQTKTTEQLPLFPEAIRVLVDRERNQFGVQNIPTCPDTSLLWLGDFAHDGWSARMFLHQMLVILRPRWTCLDTDRLLQTRMPHRIRAKIDGAKSLSAVLKSPGQAQPWVYLSDTAIKGLLRRCFRRQRAILVLLHTRGDTMRVMVTFGKGKNSELQIQMKEHDSLDFLKDGLLNYLTKRWHECAETQLCHSKFGLFCKR